MIVTLSIIELLFYFISLIFIINRICKKEINIKLLITLSIVFYAGLIISGILFDYNTFIFIHMICQALQLIMLWLSIKNMKLISIVGIFACLYSANLVISILINCIIHIFELKQTFIYLDFLIYLINLICCISFSVNHGISDKLQKMLIVLPTKIKILTVMSFFICGIIMTMVVSNPLLDENNTWSIVLRITIILLAAFLCMTFPIVILIAMTNAYLKKQNENFETRLEAQAEYYSRLAHSNFELRRFRHDFSNMQIGLKRCIETNSWQDALIILEEGQNSIRNATDNLINYDTGNGIVDAIFIDKQQKAFNSNIQIEFSGEIPPSALSSVDLCIIFGNTLDNAVEACEKLPPETAKTIKVSSIWNKGFAFISISNPVAENVTIRDNTVETTKDDRELHGYGLYSLMKTVKKYDGEIQLTSENKTFTVNIELTVI